MVGAPTTLVTTPAPTTPASRPMGGAQRRTVWNEEKRQRTYSITDTGWLINTSIAERHGMNRSEAVEIVLRYALREGLDLGAIRGELIASPVTP